MRFKHKTDQELAEMNLIQPGQYPFEVVEAKDGTSKSGNEMMSLKLKIWDDQNRERIIFDYLLEAMHHKLKHFCDATNLTHRYDADLLMADDCVGKCGHLQLVIQKDKTGQYGDKNSVKDYIVGAKQNEAAIPKNDFHDDEIPF